MSGLGNSSLGQAPYGVGTPVTAAGNTGIPLVSTTDKMTPQDGRQIDAAKRDYVIDGNGRAYGMSRVAQLVQLALMTLRGSSVVETLGIDAPGALITPDLASRMQNDVYVALADLIQQQLISVESVDVDATARPVTRQVAWIDLTTGIEHTDTI